MKVYNKREYRFSYRNMANNKILATFRVDETDWEAFKQWSEKRGNSASAEIIRFIEASLGKTTLDDMDVVDKKIEAAIASLRAELMSNP